MFLPALPHLSHAPSTSYHGLLVPQNALLQSWTASSSPCVPKDLGKWGSP